MQVTKSWCGFLLCCVVWWQYGEEIMKKKKSIPFLAGSISILNIIIKGRVASFNDSNYALFYIKYSVGTLRLWIEILCIPHWQQVYIEYICLLAGTFTHIIYSEYGRGLFNLCIRPTYDVLRIAAYMCEWKGVLDTEKILIILSWKRWKKILYFSLKRHIINFVNY